MGEAIGDSYTGEVLIKLGDNVSTDHISPAGVEAITYRTNMPALADFTFRRVDETFASRAREAGGGIIVGAKTYGQGSAREQAAICPMILGVRAVIAKTFARIHRANLINWGILPLTFVDEDDYEKVDQGQSLSISNIQDSLTTGVFQVENQRDGQHLRRGVRADRARAADARCGRGARPGPHRRGWTRRGKPLPNAG